MNVCFTIYLDQSSSEGGVSRRGRGKRKGSGLLNTGDRAKKLLNLSKGHLVSSGWKVLHLKLYRWHGGEQDIRPAEDLFLEGHLL